MSLAHMTSTTFFQGVSYVDMVIVESTSTQVRDGGPKFKLTCQLPNYQRPATTGASSHATVVVATADTKSELLALKSAIGRAMHAADHLIKLAKAKEVKAKRRNIMPPGLEKVVTTAAGTDSIATVTDNYNARARSNGTDAEDVAF